MTTQERTKGEGQRLRVTREMAALVRRLEKLEPGDQAVIIYEVEAGGRRRWWLGYLTESEGG